MNSQKVIGQLEQHIKEIILAKWLDGFGTVQVKLKNDPNLTGATNALHYKVNSKLGFVVKYHLQDVPAEKKGYAILKESSTRFSKHLVPPLFANEINSAVLLTPYLVSSSLHEIISNKPTASDWIINELYEDFLAELRALWQNTLSPVKPNLKEIYLKRILDRAIEIGKYWRLKNINDTEFVLNGVGIGKFRKIIDDIEVRLNKLEKGVKYSCTTHGDEHAKNILVKTKDIGIYKNSWVLIDYVNAKRNSDWIFSIAKILHWWEIYFVIEENKSKKIESKMGNCTVDTKRNLVKLWYDPRAVTNRQPVVCKKLSKRIHAFLNDVGCNLFKEDSNILEERLAIAMFSILFGGAVRHLDKENRFAIPVLLGESLNRLAKLTGR